MSSVVLWLDQTRRVLEINGARRGLVVADTTECGLIEDDQSTWSVQRAHKSNLRDGEELETGARARRRS